jgi:hypothetical protein
MKDIRVGTQVLNNFDSLIKLIVKEQYFWIGCLVCSECHTSLTVKCYMRNGQPYCKDDFYKRFAKTKCANCELGNAF